jgi:hypothetical protein
MDTLDAVDVAAFDQHLLECDECWGIVEATDEYVRAMRAVTERFKPLGS